jgi:hypothetical protein
MSQVHLQEALYRDKRIAASSSKYVATARSARNGGSRRHCSLTLPKEPRPMAPSS